jgi:MFS family permease
MSDATAHKTSLKVALLSMSLLNMAGTAVSPTLASIAKAFPDISPETIQMLFALPGLVMIPFTLISGALGSRISKKFLVLLGMAIFAVGGVAPVFLDSFTLILVSRVVFGAGLGLLYPFTAGFLADFFQGPELQSIMGTQAAMINVGGILAGVVPGVLAAIDWHQAFWYHAIAIIVLLLVMFFVPEPKAAAHETGEGGKGRLDRVIFGLAGAILVYGILVSVLFTNTALVIEGDHLGTPASTGNVIALSMFGGLISGILFGRIVRTLKGFTFPVGVGITGAACLIFSYAPTLGLLTFAGLILGFGMGLSTAAVFVDVGMRTSRATSGLAFAIVMAAVNLGGFLSPVILVPLGRVFGAPGTGRFAFLIAAVGLLAGFIVWVFISLWIRKGRAVLATEAPQDRIEE